MADPVLALRDLLTPVLWHGGDFTRSIALGASNNTLDLRGYLRRADGFDSGASERQVRTHLHEQAETVIHIVEELGYRHLAAPRIDIGGEVQFDPVPIGEGPRSRVIAEGEILLSLWREDL